jgi:Family of unknown function (DUF5627)/Domain of unknown function (DUF1735)
MKKFLLITLVFSALTMGCNKDWSFPDYKYSTVYFAYQTPVRTIVLGEDIYDNTLDNQHKCLVIATMGGVYENKNDVVLKVDLDKTLAARLKFETASGDTVLAMPDNYYSISAAKGAITIPAGKFTGGLEVQLTDAFFQDPLSLKRTYVIPLKINSVQNADSILRGRSDLTSPDPRKAADWVIPPKDYILYAVKYINPYHGFYLRRGIDNVTGNGGNTSLDTNVVYHAQFVEKDEVCSIVTTALDEVSVSLNAKNKGNINAPFTMLLKFDNQGKCTIRNPSTAAYTITGTGAFVKKGDSWGNQQRDVLHLKYQIAFGSTTHNLTDTIVVRDRGVKMETFNPVVVN